MRAVGALRRGLEQLVGLAILAATGWFLWARRDTIAEVVNFSWELTAALAVGVLLSWLVTSTQSLLLFRTQDVSIGFVDNLVLSVAAAFGNYLPMRAGTLVRLRYMKQRHGLRYARFGSMSGMRVVLLVSATGILGLVGVVGVWVTTGRLLLLLTPLFAGLFAVAAAAFLLRLPRAAATGGLARRAWNDFVDGFEAIRQAPGIAVRVAGLIVVQQALLAARIYLSLRAVDIDTSFFVLVLLGPLTALVSTIAITPGAIGLREAVIGYVTFATGTTFDSGAIAGSIDRAVLLCLIIVLGSAAFVRTWWQLQQVREP